ncbi:RCC1 domain-containing protein, partial [Hyalangium sp.]|uniref:RCC1 domain-containing protein n=1 Tax=Hyalangium sp. TaxID=2028555 RepID=UPI002D70F4C8|nr:hypothetical protein [Hyalangium sp.]
MLVVCLASVTARAESPPEPEELSEQGSAEQRRRKSARRVLATQDGYTLAIDERGTLWEWGSARGHGPALTALGETVSPTPARVRDMPKTVSVSMTNGLILFHSLALQEDGKVQAWGVNQYGQLGDGTTTPRLTRVTVPGLTDIVAIATGGVHSLAVREDGTVWAWGNNQVGQLGDGTLAVSRSLPVQVVGLTRVVAVVAGFAHSLALREDGTVWGWGDNTYGQLGTGTGLFHLVPVRIMALTDVVAIEARDDSAYAVRADGTVWSWGINSSGMLGLPPEITLQPVPAQVPGLTRVVSLAAGNIHVLALRRDGTVWSWGSNGSGAVGHGPRAGIRTPGPVPGLHGVE